ncbi:hypothetical protein IGB42_01964 [Andreprevotia sp. IGB-42]|uniref:hypothetical protein n=1 Tax=Andreprevotia sp. IGB-42 TaxID=2497473 RepID=UPI00135835A2|nr:hypothetical protein [Andreprevotia sp. IGB-42]KAF0813613.1 hypothetical protein IGB42_01964 [Andreprevotia sp. IGB-42]
MKKQRSKLIGFCIAAGILALGSIYYFHYWYIHTPYAFTEAGICFERSIVGGSSDFFSYDAVDCHSGEQIGNLGSEYAEGLDRLLFPAVRISYDYSSKLAFPDIIVSHMLYEQEDPIVLRFHDSERKFHYR